jgi:mannose-6-phosphate isomerase class I
MPYFPGRTPTYDRFPHIAVDGHACDRGWDAIASRLAAAGARVLTIECYVEVLDEEVLPALVARLKPARVIDTATLFKPVAQIEAMVQPGLTDDPVFGRLSGLEMGDFLDAAKVAEAVRAIAGPGLTLVYGRGASLVHPGDVLVYADISRWEGQLRQRRGQVSNLAANNRGAKASLQYKRGYFCDWRVADRLKRRLWPRIDFLLDSNAAGDPKLITGACLRESLHAAARRPFRVVPFFDPAPWGGQWMKEVCGLPADKPNYGWCFDGVPEENSLLLRVAGVDVEIPSQDLVYQEPRALLGDPVHGRFGAEFPIRFDFLDTMGGGNLSLQVHPLTEYIQDRFGMHYTQDESYYMLDAAPGAHVYLGVREDIDPTAMKAALETAQAGGAPFPAERFAGRYPAAKHDHFLIPAGTLHCSGAESMVLEISATPYIFTFKQWDWGRNGLDGKPRPVHLEHGAANIQFDRTEAWVKANLINRVTALDAGDGWRRERTGLHEREFIDTVRCWFAKAYPATTGGLERGGVHMLNLIEGEDAVIESPTGAFAPYTVHYAETFIIPAAAGAYTVRPGPAATAKGQTCATITACVRTQP